MLTELAGDGECGLALFHAIRNFLANEIYHFSRLSHQKFWMQFSLVATFFPLVLVICLSTYLHLKLSRQFLIFVSFNIWRYNFTSGAIYLKRWKPNHLSKRLKDQSIWTGPKYKCKVSSYMNSTKVLLHSKLNLGFNLNYFSFLLWILSIYNYSFLYLMFFVFCLSKNNYIKHTQ